MPMAKQIKREIGYEHGAGDEARSCGNCASVRIGGPSRRPNPKTTECVKHGFLRVARLGRCSEWSANAEHDTRQQQNNQKG